MRLVCCRAIMPSRFSSSRTSLNSAVGLQSASANRTRRNFIRRVALVVCLGALGLIASARAASYDVRAYGAKGDGKTIDTGAINQAIDAAAAAGGGTVEFPAGTYLSFSIHLRSNIALHLDAGSILVAASPATDGGRYDPPEPNEAGDKQYQDFGHSHWHDSLIWGEDLHDVAILGPGEIYGKGIVRFAGSGRRGGAVGSTGRSRSAANASPSAPAAPSDAAALAQSAGPNGTGFPKGLPPPPAGAGTKTIALKNCRNVTLRDFSVLQGGWFALLATGVDNMTIDNLRVDTNRDGFDIDACRNVRIVNCTVNAINDDAIVLKSSYALGIPRACENITISGCQVSGYDVGSFLAGQFQETQAQAPDRDGPTGRIKLGTESNGGFRNIAISNCVFVRSRGLALETVDGGVIEDVSITNVTMREVSSSPIFLRIGNRGRGPDGTGIGAIRRITISHVIASDCDARYPILIAGLPGHPVQDVRLSDVRVTFRGGITMEQVAQQPAGMVNAFFLRGPGLTGPRDPFAPPEQEKAYPEPSMFGLLPAYGLFVRHAANLAIDHVSVGFTAADHRAAIVLMDVVGVRLDDVQAPHAADAATFELRAVQDFFARAVAGLPDTQETDAERKSL